MSEQYTKRGNIIQYTGPERNRTSKKKRFHVGTVIFVFLFLYLMYTLISFALRKDYSTYTVGREEDISSTRTYQALILRDEKVVSSEWNGYLDLFAQECARVSVGAVVATVDELGVYSETIRKEDSSRALTDEDLIRLKSHLSGLALTYDSQQFRSIYTEKNIITSYFVAGVSEASLDFLEESMTLAEFFHQKPAEVSGLVSYYEDGFETMTPAAVKAEDFNAEKYSRRTPEYMVSKGDFLYKIIDSENWSLIVPLSNEEAALYNQESSLSITFLSNNLTLNCPFRLFSGADGGLYLEITLDRYLIQFISDRYTKIRINLVSGNGYKIPTSALTSKLFYIIPKNFKALGGAEDETGFLTETYGEKGTEVSFISPAIYYEDDEYYYVSTDDIASGTVLVSYEPQERYTVRMTTSLKGVYQVNRGYTVFRRIEILEQTADYYYIATDTDYGVSTFDIILLNASDAQEGQILK